MTEHRTLLLSEVFPPRTGGSGRWFWEIYRRLSPDTFSIAAGATAGDAAFDASHDLAITRLPMTWPDWGLFGVAPLRRYAATARRLTRLVRRQGIDVIHCGRCVPEGWLGLLLRCWLGIPYVCYAHGEDVNVATSASGAGVLSSRQLRWMTRRVLKHASAIIANSHNTAAILRDQWAIHRRVHVLHPGVDTHRFRPAGFDRAMRQRLGWDQRPVILTVGRLQKRKGHDVLIRALPRIRQRIPQVVYAIVGTGEELFSLRQLVENLGLTAHVQFLGEIPDDLLIPCYQQCDVFVLPNRAVGPDIEGFGMVLLEAQACGKPVLAGASGGTAETLHPPATGCVIPCETPDRLADVLADWLSDDALRESMGQAARRWVVERFDWSALAQEADALFARLAHPEAVTR